MVLNLFKELIRCWIAEKRTLERPSSFPRIKLKDTSMQIGLTYYHLKNVADTNSMDPLLDIGHKAILKKYEFNDTLHVGDVIVYKSGKLLIIHRIINILSDDEGTYYTCKGDNNFYIDNVRVRYDMIRYILVGVLY